MVRYRLAYGLILQCSSATPTRLFSCSHRCTAVRAEHGDFCLGTRSHCCTTTGLIFTIGSTVLQKSQDSQTDQGQKSHQAPSWIPSFSLCIQGKACDEKCRTDPGHNTPGRSMPQDLENVDSNSLDQQTRCPQCQAEPVIASNHCDF